MEILGVRIDNLRREEAQARVRLFLNSSGPKKIFTPNPEFLVRAQQDKFFKEILATGDLNLCDGFGVSLFTGIKRITGADFVWDIFKIAEENENRIFLLGTGNENVLAQAEKKILKKFSKLKIVGKDKGPVITDDFYLKKKSACFDCGDKIWLKINKEENDRLIKKINDSGAEVILVAFGMGKQEKWIYENLAKIPKAKVFMGVGGSLDYVAEKVKRAPCWMRCIGIEWIYRLIQEPKRSSRILNATLKFVYLVIKEKILP